MSKLADEEFFDYHPATGNVSPLDYRRIARRLKKTRTGSARAAGVVRGKARLDALAMADEWAAATPNPPLFLPYTFLESVLYVSGGTLMTKLRRNACGGHKGQFVYYGQALAEFNRRWEVLRKKTPGKGRPPTMPLLEEHEWPWKTAPTGIDPEEIMPAGWDYNALLPAGINMLPKWPNDPPRFSEDWNGIKGEPGVLRSHVKAIVDYLETDHGGREWKKIDEASRGVWGTAPTWTADRWVADIITDYCLKKPYKPFLRPNDEEIRIALTEGRMVW